MGFFDSPREREAKKLYGSQIGAFDREIGSFDDLLNQIAGIDTNKVRDIYGAARRGLSTKLGQARSAAGFRLSGANATPEATFLPIEGEFASGFADIGQAQARDTLETMFRRLGLSLAGRRAKGELLSRRSGSLDDYLGALSGASGFDDVLSVVSTISKFLPEGD